MFTPNTKKVNANPGKRTIQGASAKWRIMREANKPPQEMTTPPGVTPRKLSDASTMITDPIEVVATTIMRPKVFGATCLTIIRKVFAPILRAASTYGVSLMLRTCERITLTPLLENMRVRANIRLANDGPKRRHKSECQQKMRGKHS